LGSSEDTHGIYYNTEVNYNFKHTKYAIRLYKKRSDFMEIISGFMEVQQQISVAKDTLLISAMTSNIQSYTYICVEGNMK